MVYYTGSFVAMQREREGEREEREKEKEKKNKMRDSPPTPEFDPDVVVLDSCVTDYYLLCRFPFPGKSMMKESTRDAKRKANRMKMQEECFSSESSFWYWKWFRPKNEGDKPTQRSNQGNQSREEDNRIKEKKEAILLMRQECFKGSKEDL